MSTSLAPTVPPATTTAPAASLSVWLDIIPVLYNRQAARFRSPFTAFFILKKRATARNHDERKLPAALMFAVQEMNLIAQGAEGKVYSTIFLSRPTIIKERVSKSYRVKELDVRLNVQRLRQEARCMTRCRRAGILTPCLYLLDQQNSMIYMERVTGSTVKALLRSRDGDYSGPCIEWAKEVGAAIGKMHDTDIVHGDLTTSNMMIRDADSKVVLIDFGLSSISTVVEDKAVDLYVLERAFISTHPGSEKLVEQVLESYRFSCRKGTIILAKLEQVRQRGRKRDMFG